MGVNADLDRMDPLRVAAVGRRVNALFRAMSTDLLLREQFVTDPAQILAEYVDGSRLSPQRASAVNQLLYAVAANTDVLLWLRNYVLTRLETPTSREQFMTDFGRAVTEKQATHVVLALLRLSMEKEAMPMAPGSLVQIIHECGLFDGETLSGTEMSTGTQFGTEQSGTHMSTGAAVISGTEMSTGTQFGTEQSGTHMSTGAAVISGTEMSTGTQFGTEVSGTQVSTGPRLFSGQAASAVEALVEYAGRLRDRGLLDSVWSQ